jgi:hypothetical protein
MKHQYFGDVIDYRKYGVLRALAATTGLRLGICWFLTADDQPRHGELRRYLQQPGRWRQFDPDLYERLRRLLVPGTDRSVAHARHWDLVPGATYFEALLGDGPRARDEYFDAAWKAMADSDLVFFDPDRGIEVQSTPIDARGSCQYVYWRELIHAHRTGKSILVYQHYPRIARERFVPFLAQRLEQQLGPPLTAFRTPHAVLFLVAHARHRAALSAAPTAVSGWSGQIEPWP